jgi:hypothetical protein
MRRRTLGIATTLVLLLGMLVGTASGEPGSNGSLVARSWRVSGVAQPAARLSNTGGPTQPAATCSTPGSGNYKADCNSSGRAVNETWIASNGSTYVAGANDYNSYNGQADWGYYTSDDALTWTDNAPLDLFPEDPNNAAGDPGLAIDAAGVVYYSGIFFSYINCNVGGVELARRDPSTGTWTYYQIRANSDAEFQDKPAVAVDGRQVFVSWTLYGSCTGVGVTSPIKVAVFNAGVNSGPPINVLSVPDSKYSQGSALATDGRGGFWITWEEFDSPDDLVGEIKLAHYSRQHGWSPTHTISPPEFADLPNPLPGFAFRNNSFPAITFAAGRPRVVWASYDSGRGRVYLWELGQVTPVSDQGGDQFFPSIATIGQTYAISWSQTKPSNLSFDQYMSFGGVSKVSTASSFPNSDPFFVGTFIGDYNGMAAAGSSPHPIWTDVRGPTFEQNAMVYAA